MKVVTIRQPVMQEQAERAAMLRQRMAERGTMVVNLLSSPGAGKTTLLQATARQISSAFRLAALVGDIATDRDAERLKPAMPAVQLTTGGACHLELPLVEAGLARIDADQPLDFLFIENVGNLVCPASFDLGEHVRVVLLATTEGDDKPQKYPKAFRTADVCLISKVDLLQYVPFSPASAQTDARAIRPDLRFLEVSGLTGHGIADWCNFLVEARRTRVACP